MKCFSRIALFNLLVLIAGTTQAHTGHGGTGFTHSISGFEQLLLAFVLTSLIYQSALLLRKVTLPPKLITVIKSIKDKLT